MTSIYELGQTIDHYQILRLLGRGGASRVYLAQDLQTQREVVLKFPNDEVIGGAEIYQRHQREAEIGSLLRHPCIQAHLNLGEERSQDYLVMEYLQGQTLRATIKAHAPALLPQTQALHIMCQISEGLIYAHEHGIVHRDIKPENIIVLDNGDAKILDFGIALRAEKHHWPSLTLSPLVGTPDYMAPERLEGKPGDVRADIYAVGAVLYELLCGRPPFEEKDGFTLINPHISHDPPNILHWNPTLSPALATVVMRAIRRDADRRYAQMRNMLYDLTHLDAIEPVDYVPAPPKLGGQYRQVLRIALIVLIISLALIGFGLFAQFAHHAVR